MAHKYPNILVHLVFNTKQRRESIPLKIQDQLWKYFGGIGRNHSLPVLCAGGTSNHAHLLVALPSDMTVAKAVQVLKANSSRWIGEHGVEFNWQEGYGAFSVSASLSEKVRDYIDHQQSHHQHRSYEDEFKSLLMKSNVPFTVDEVFD